MSDVSYRQILAQKYAELGDGCFQCGRPRRFGDFCTRECQTIYYQTDGPTRRWARTELAAENDYRQLLLAAMTR